MGSKITYLYFGFFTQFDSKRFGIDFYKNLNLQVELVSLHKIFLKSASYEAVAKGRALLPSTEVVNIDTLDQLFLYLQTSNTGNLKHIIFIIIYPGASELPYIISFIKAKLTQAYVVMYAYEVIPYYKRNTLAANLRISLSKTRRKLKKTFGVLGDIEIDILLAASLKNYDFYKSFHIVGKHTQILPAYSLDMENILFENNFENKGQTLELSSPYIVYIDSSFGGAGDDATHGFKTTYTHKEYFAILKPFFVFLEKTFNAKVVIAAHPTSNAFVCESGAYEGFSYFKYKTYELIKNAKFCCTEVSTAMSYAIYLKKPLLLLYSDFMREYERHYSCSFYQVAKALCKQVIRLDRGEFCVDLIYKELENFSGYSSYRDNYLIYPGANLKESIFMQLLCAVDKH